MSAIAPHTAQPYSKDEFSRDDTAFLGHPAGLGWLSFCELWERFSYYGMQILLGLYLTKYLFLPEHIGSVMGINVVRVAVEAVTGPRTPLQLGLFISGLYAGLVYLTPIFGGLIADRLLGRTKTIVMGASLMALGHFLMAFESSFLLAIACLLVGVGCFKGNIAAQVGALYAPGDKRNATAFQIFLMSVQIAVIGAPLVCGTLGEKVGFHWGFGAAGVGMLIGLVTYLVGRGWLPPEPKLEKGHATVEQPPLTRTEWGRLWLLIGLLPLLMLSIVGNQQFNIGFTVWSDKHMDLMMFGWQVPVTWLQGVDAFVSSGTMLMSIAFWSWYSKRRNEPDELMKMAIGSMIAAGGPALMAIAGQIVDTTHGKVGPIWTLAYTVVNDIGFANVLAVGLALYSRVAPRQIVGLVIGIYYLHLFVANTFVGWLGGFMDIMSNRDFWALHALLVVAAGVLLLVARAMFGRLLSAETMNAERDAAG
ncbi:peptide MFS transporter [Scleromatobacter humisilvae]|uniref:Peptide MFS transporter n=1 Tax=Scleromatobacter humisilvae TaxID=2897159 RepID=A0A9X1YK63_9BURK|nr:peptide MFS transporter [Scleromatobacter humisilvae]MCK9688014.1 peptide MFS transporter [Scleromatobacter humisilvae]